MKILFIVLGIIYLVIAVIALSIQAGISSLDNDQSDIPWKMITKQSFGWPVILIKLFMS